MTLLGVALLLMPLQQARAVHPATGTALKDIEKQLAEARKHDLVIRNWRRAEQIKAGKIPPPSFNLTLERRLETEPGAAMDQLRSARDERDKAMTRAIELTVIATGLAPRDADGYPRMPERPVIDTTLKAFGVPGPLRWLPTYRDPPPRSRILARHPHDKERLLEVDLTEAEIEKHDGVTWSEGTTLIWPALDNLTTAGLTRLLHHELNHFLSLTDPKKAAMGQAAREVEILKEDIDQLGNFGFPPGDLATWTQRLGRRKRQAEIERVYDDTKRKNERLRRGFSRAIKGGASGDEENVDSSIPDLLGRHEEVLAIRKRGEELTEQVRREDRERREREEYARRSREEAQRRANETPASSPSYPSHPGSYSNGSCGGTMIPCVRIQPPPVPAQARPSAPPAVAAAPAAPAVAYDAWQVLNGLAARGCADPWSVQQNEIDGVWPSLIRLPYDTAEADRRGLLGCQRDLFLRLLSMASSGNPARLTREIFIQAAHAARPEPAFTDPRFDSGPDVPSVPTCRFHPWCREWNP